MKKILLLIIPLLMVSCKSDEQKALALIDRWMFDNLHDYSSYEPIETVIQNGYSSVYDDEQVIERAKQVVATIESYEQMMGEVIYAGTMAESLAFSRTASGKADYKKYEDQFHNKMGTCRVYATLGRMDEDSLRSAAARFVPQHIGWEVAHKFRAKDNEGGYSILVRHFMIDGDFKKVTSSYDPLAPERPMIVKVIDMASDSISYWGDPEKSFVYNDMRRRWKQR